VRAEIEDAHVQQCRSHNGAHYTPGNPAVVAIHTPGLGLLGDRDNAAVLWDIRVAPRERRAGIGSALFRSAGNWARARGCEWLTIETQNINAAACHFYRKMGCTLGAIDRFAYPGLPGEAQLLWWRALASDGLSALACRLPRGHP
jgi:ribosomal protein S18 acetylase RimI-like enzyme